MMTPEKLQEIVFALHKSLALPGWRPQDLELIRVVMDKLLDMHKALSDAAATADNDPNRPTTKLFADRMAAIRAMSQLVDFANGPDILRKLGECLVQEQVRIGNAVGGITISPEPAQRATSRVQVPAPITCADPAPQTGASHEHSAAPATVVPARAATAAATAAPTDSASLPASSPVQATPPPRSTIQHVSRRPTPEQVMARMKLPRQPSPVERVPPAPPRVLAAPPVDPEDASQSSGEEEAAELPPLEHVTPSPRQPYPPASE